MRANVDRIRNQMHKYGVYRGVVGEAGTKGPVNYLMWRVNGETSREWNGFDPKDRQHMVQISKNWVIDKAYAIVKNPDSTGQDFRVGMVFVNEDMTASVLCQAAVGGPTSGSVYQVAGIPSINAAMQSTLGDEVTVIPYHVTDTGVYYPEMDVIFVVEFIDKSQ